MARTTWFDRDHPRPEGMFDGELNPIDGIDAVERGRPTQFVMIVGQVAEDGSRVGDIDVADPDRGQPAPCAEMPGSDR